MLNILLVEDQEEGRALLAEFLTLEGFHVTTADNGMSALARVAESRPDLVLMDLAMPVLDGWETTRRLKSDPRTGDITIWALTAFSDRGALGRARDAGCSHTLLKPVSVNDLVAQLRSFESTLAPRPALPTEENPGAPPAPTLEI